MINKITISNVASYGDDPVLINNLKEINYFFGANGSGKTTISRIIGKDSSALEWESNPIDCFVYNSDFIEENFKENSSIKGIFTLGSNNIGVEKEIENKTTLLRDKNKLFESLKKTLNGTLGSTEDIGKIAELNSLKKIYEDKVWKRKSEFDDTISQCFVGYNNSKSKFFQKVLDEYDKNHTGTNNLKTLTSKAQVIFSNTNSRTEELPKIPHQEIDNIINSPIFEKVIVGREDIEIGRFWKNLQNSDWVKKGKEYLNEEKLCPFCKQKLEDDFISNLEEYFDESYQNNLNELKSLEQKYTDLVAEYSSKIQNIINLKDSHIDNVELTSIYEKLENIFSENLKTISDKIANPSVKYNLQSHKSLMGSADDLLQKANEKIKIENDILSNISEEKSHLICDVWNFLVSSPFKSDIETFNEERKTLEKAIQGIKTRISNTENEISDLKDQISNLERTRTSIKGTIDSINKTLDSFGFKGFHLEESVNNSYKLVRNDGSDVKRTLSEGERTFVIFLYFYHLLNGSLSESGINSPRIVVIDDPVSSLDANVLFIVTTLIKNIREKVLNNDSKFKQLFILTHNVYFFRQVSFSKQNEKRADSKSTYWIVRKKDFSTVTSYEKNPIKNSYQLLWEELKKLDETKLCDITICNTMRRILETYFKTLGAMDDEKLVNFFIGNDKVICSSLLSWVNAGSHNIFDDEFFALPETEISKYLDVFEKIFEQSGHIAHFNMMMGRE